MKETLRDKIINLARSAAEGKRIWRFDTLGRELKQALRKKDFGISDFADAVGIDMNEARLILSDHYRPDGELLMEIAQECDLDPKWLAFLSTIPTAPPLSLPVLRATATSPQEWSDSQKEDAALLESFNAGNHESVGILFDKYQGYIFSVFQNYDLPHDTSEELLQETWKKVLIAFAKGQYRERGQFKAWLAKVAKSSFFDWYRQKNPLEIFKDIYREFSEILPSADEMEASEKLAAREMYQQALAQLTERERHVYVMRVEDDKSAEEVGLQLDMTANNVNATFLRARRKLAEAIGEHGDLT